MAHQEAIVIAVAGCIAHGKADDERFVLVEQSTAQEDVQDVVAAERHSPGERNRARWVFQALDDFWDLCIDRAREIRDSVGDFAIVIGQTGEPVSPVASLDVGIDFFTIECQEQRFGIG